MVRNKTISLLLSSVLVGGLYGDELDDDLLDLLNMQSEVTADVGSRSGAVNQLDSLSPTDVVSTEQIKLSGYRNLSDVLRYFISGYNAPEVSISDGSDHIRAFTLRGMSPDQVLVLVNGKRLHTSSLLHVNATIGRGSSHVDLDTIAIDAIEKIEILRDGAAAQYGSDAISGVVNIILKGYGFDNEATLHAGIRQQGDGERARASGFISIPQQYDGFINLSLDASTQRQTQRANEVNEFALSHVGQPDRKDLKLLLNSQYNLQNDTTLYATAIYNYRNSESGAFFRPASIDNSMLYPNGFLPSITAKVDDFSLTLGVRDTVGGVDWDISNTLGINRIKYSLENSMNYAYGGTSARDFNLGRLGFLQNSTNLDLKHSFGDFDLAGGAEYRYEKYEIKSGDSASYDNGGISQGFAGYTPDNSTNENRNSYALYLDGLYRASEKLTLNIAARYEKYSDFGSTTNLKIAGGYKVADNLSIRSSASTGFRAPSLAQSFYSHTSTFGVNTEGTFRVDDPISRALGAVDLKPEKSKHFTLGTIYQPSGKSSFSIDYFYTEVEDRIMLSNEHSVSIGNVNKARFFTNAVDTKTEGVDVKFSHKSDFDSKGELESTIWYNYAKNSIKSFNDASQNRANSFEQADRMESGQPRHSVRILNRYKIDNLTASLNLSHHGSYAQVVNNTRYGFDSEWIADLDINYAFNRAFNISLGAHNLFDSYPSQWGSGVDDKTLTRKYSRYAPFGYGGAYYYINANYRF